VAPTVIEVDTESANVTPAWTRVLLDFRTASESSNSLQAFVQNLVGDWPVQISNAMAKESNEPFEDSDEPIYGYYTAPNDKAVERVRTAVFNGTSTKPELTRYQFATDGRHFVPLGVPIIGYSAGEDHFAHTVDERISIPMMVESLHGHLSLLETY
jgi:acetylornithine deacetylase/succinyl-diaminopimelate desuccinylase-like protein